MTQVSRLGIGNGLTPASALIWEHGVPKINRKLSRVESLSLEETSNSKRRGLSRSIGGANVRHGPGYRRYPDHRGEVGIPGTVAC